MMMTAATDFETHDGKQLEEVLAAPKDVPAGLNGWIKRGLDLLLAVPTFLFILPLLAFIALIIRLESRGPVIFEHTRCGRGGKAFTCYKFRTMKTGAPDQLQDLLANNPAAAEEWAQSQKLKSDPRVTRFGAFLRKTSLDELPQLINIIAGDMSVIGPRPVTFDELPRYGSKLAYYMAARPGVTGLWQVNGRNSLSYQQRVAYDAEYAKKWSLFKDFKIMIKTIPVVLLSKDAY